MVLQPAAHNLEQGDIDLPSTGRPVVRSNAGVISSGTLSHLHGRYAHVLSGGNAFDALVAAGFAAAVVEPIASYSLAAEGVSCCMTRPTATCCHSAARAVRPARQPPISTPPGGLERIPTGPGMNAPLSFTLPGIVDAFIAMLDRYGTMELTDVLAPAISYAADGIPHYEYMLGRLHAQSGQQQFDNSHPAVGRVL